MKKRNYCFWFLILLVSCINKKIEITSEYIINENWSKKNEQAWANSITINEMRVKKDSIINPFSNLSQAEVLDKLETDSSFMHYTNVKIGRGESYKDKKIYFNRDNGFYWGGKNRHNSDDTTKTIRVLQAGCWYKFSDLGSIDLSNIYVYIDSANNVHRFNVISNNY